MNILLIKIGKSWQVLKRDGLLNGFRRIFGAFFMLFRFVGSGDILFISGGIGDSARYRTVHVAEELEFNGFKCAVTVQDNPRLLNYVNKFSIFIFHRTIYTKKIAKLIDEIKKQNKTIIFETDDLVYDPKYLSHMDYYKKMNFLEKKLYENGVGGEILKDNYVEVATTTTNFLANKLRKENKKVFVVSNKLSVEDINNAKKVLLSLHKENVTTKHSQKSIIKLGYFSGTISHNKDFATITEAVAKIMKKYKNVELLLVGPLNIENKLVKQFGDRIKQLPYVKRSRHFANIAKCDVNLVPLEYNNPFCEAKSELKFFEAGIVKVPTIAVDNQTYAEAINDGVDGFLAGNTKEWIDKLSRLIDNEELRNSMGKKAYDTTLCRYTTQSKHNNEYYKYLKKIIHKIK